MLHSNNAAVFSVLASAGSGLLFSETKEVIDCAEEILSTETRQALTDNSSVKDSDSLIHNTLQIDTNKSFLLAHTFPDDFPSALALLTSKAVLLEIWGSVEDPAAVVNLYVTGEGNGVPVFPRVSAVPTRDDVNGQKQKEGLKDDYNMLSSDNLRDLGAVEPLARDIETCFGIVRNQSSQINKLEHLEVESRLEVLSRSTHVHVDPYSWFCSCNLDPEKRYDRSGQKVVDDNTNGLQNVIHLFLVTSTCRFPEKLPMCLHLLAILLAALNWGTVQQNGLVKACVVAYENKP